MLDRRTFITTLLAGTAAASLMPASEAEAAPEALSAPVEMQGAEDAASEPDTPGARGRGRRRRRRSSRHHRRRRRRHQAM